MTVSLLKNDARTFTENNKASFLEKRACNIILQKICFVVSVKSYLRPQKSSSNHTLDAADVHRNDIHGCFSIRNVLLRAVSLLKSIVLL